MKSKRLSFEEFGETVRKKKLLIIAHGLFGSGRNWRTIAKRISEYGIKVVVVDMRNHGRSFWDTRHTYNDLAEDLKTTIDQFGGFADVMGHSMGGKAAMTLSLRYPDSIGKLVVVDISPVTYFHDQSQYIRAMELIDLEKIENRKQADLQLSQYIMDPNLRAFFIQSIDFQKSGRKKWLINLLALKENLTEIMAFPVFTNSNINETLFLRGAKSDYITDEHVPIINGYFPKHQISVLEDAGHWLHSEQPKKFLEKVTDFLTSDS